MKKRSLSIAGHRTSISIEEPFWQALKEIAVSQGISLAALVAAIDGRRENGVNLSSAIRVEVLDHYRQSADGRQPSDQKAPARR